MSNTTSIPTRSNTLDLIEWLLEQNGKYWPTNSRLLYGATVELEFIPAEYRLSFLAVLIEASRCKERCSPLPFYAERAERGGDLYWLDHCGSYGSFGLDAEDIRYLAIKPEVLDEIIFDPKLRTELNLPSRESSTPASATQ